MASRIPLRTGLTDVSGLPVPSPPSMQRPTSRRTVSVEWATIQTLSLECGAPTAEAGIQSQTASYLSAKRSPRTVPIPRPSKLATFSTMMNCGRTSPMIRRYSSQRPDRAPLMPDRFPAVEMSWHGNPPQMTSMSVIPSRRRVSALSSRTSSYIGTPGQCLDSTRRQKGSISQNATVSNPPVRSSPRENPPMPLKRSSVFSIRHSTRCSDFDFTS